MTAAVIPRLAGPNSPHRITSWGGLGDGRRRSVCSCSPDTDPAAPACVDYALARRLLADAWTLATAHTDVKPRSWPKPEHPGPLTARAQRERGTALLGLVVAAGAGGPQLESGGPSVSELQPAGQAETPEPQPEPVDDQGGQEDEPVGARAVSGVGVDLTALLAATQTPAPAPAHTCIVWVRSDVCPHCQRRHAARGNNRPPLCFDPTYVPPTYCRVCEYPVDPVAAAEFAGRHAICSLPVAERLRWESDVREHGRRRRAAQLAREEDAA